MGQVKKTEIDTVNDEGQYHLIARELSCQFCGQPTADELHRGERWCGSLNCLAYYYSRHKYVK